MNARAIAELLLRVWGAILAIGGLTSLPLHISMMAPSSGSSGWLERWSLLSAVLSVLVQIAVGAWLVRRGDAVARVVVPETLRVELPADDAQLQRLAFVLVGLLVLLSGLQDAAAGAFSWATLPRSGDTSPFSNALYLLHQTRLLVARGVVAILAGALLLLGRRRVADAWSVLRSRPLDDENESEGPNG
ncbi:MAG: hypothetical protein R2991_08660 [Thermoanaerobaculia bacterium]